jgi:Lecithin retinol acyltransferase
MIRSTDNARSTRRSEQPCFTRDSPLRPGEEPPLASHLITPRALYTHHGIYVGSGRVIHYAGFAYGWWRGPVEDVSLERFAHGHGVQVRRDQHCFDPRAVVERARSRLGERSYRILTNNCEHFCAWALRDEHRSSQVERLRVAPHVIYRAICQALRECLLVNWESPAS